MKQYILYLCILIFGFGLLNAQQDDIPVDSIYILRQLSKDDIKYTPKERLAFAQRSLEFAKLTKVDSIILWGKVRLANVNFDNKKYDIFYKQVYNCIKTAKAAKNKSVLNTIYIDIGNSYNHAAQRDSAYFYFLKAKELNFPSNISYSTYIGLASIQFSVNDLSKSEENLIVALKLLSKSPETIIALEQKWDVYNTLGMISHKQERYDDALYYYKKANGICKRTIDKNHYALGKLLQLYTYNNIAEIYQQQKDYTSALKFYNKAISDNNNNNNILKQDPSFYPLVLTNINYTEFLKGDKSTGNIISNLKSSYMMCNTLEDGYDKIITQMASCFYLSKIYLSEEHLDNAYKYAKLSYRFAKSIQENEYVLKSLKLLADLEEGDAGKTYLKEYITLSDSITKEERLMRNKFARIEYESDQLEANNETLIKEKKWLYYIATGVLSISLLVYIILMQRSKNRKLKFAKAQQKANEDIYSLILAQQHQLEEGRLQERHRVSEELHDGVLSKLFGTRLGLSFLELKGNTEDVKKFNNYLEQINTIEKDVRHLSHNLKTSDLNAENGFNTILKTLLDEQTELHNIQYNTTNTALVNWKTVNDQIKVNLYRIIQEALYNIIKHAEAKTINLDFNPTENNLELIIRDDGKGFNPKKVKKGIGLKNIASRIKKLDGTFNLESNFKQGTILKLSVPL